jgi:mannose-6-phosphate isomerase-like protein (cupin superfamily)
MLFIDDSVLTMGEKSKVVIKEFLYSKDKGGKSIFNLIDGKMRSVVGKSEFEIHTPTVVAAARGTVFDCETGKRGEELFTTCTCYEGVVDVRSIDPTIAGRVSLRAGMTVTVPAGQPVPAPRMVPAALTAPAGPVAPGAAETMRLPQAPPILQQAPPVRTTTPVDVSIKLPPVPAAPPVGSIQVGW